jgi:hypothetical protein
MAHGQWTEIEARDVLEASKRSGLGVEKFARSRGLVPQRLYWWKKKLGIKASRLPALVPVHVTETRMEARRGEPAQMAMLLDGIDPNARRLLVGTGEQQGDRHGLPNMIKPGRWSCRRWTTTASCRTSSRSSESPARRAASTPSNTSPMCRRACRSTRRARSTSCCRVPGQLLAMTRDDPRPGGYDQRLRKPRPLGRMAGRRLRRGLRTRVHAQARLRRARLRGRALLECD